jgi:hypothetical protein
VFENVGDFLGPCQGVNQVMQLKRQQLVAINAFHIRLAT